MLRVSIYFIVESKKKEEKYVHFFVYTNQDSPLKIHENVLFLLFSQLFQYSVTLWLHYVSDLRQVGGFLWVLRFPPTIKLTTTI